MGIDAGRKHYGGDDDDDDDLTAEDASEVARLRRALEDAGEELVEDEEGEAGGGLTHAWDADDLLWRAAPSNGQMLLLGCSAFMFLVDAAVLHGTQANVKSPGPPFVRGTALLMCCVTQPLIGRHIVRASRFHQLMQTTSQGPWADECCATIPRPAKTLISLLVVVGCLVKTFDVGLWSLLHHHNESLSKMFKRQDKDDIYNTFVKALQDHLGYQALPGTLLMLAIPVACIMCWYPLYSFLVHASVGLVDDFEADLGSGTQASASQREEMHFELKAGLEHIWSKRVGIAYVAPVLLLLLIFSINGLAMADLILFVFSLACAVAILWPLAKVATRWSRAASAQQSIGYGDEEDNLLE
jgi:hypothetical protein